MIHAIIMNIRFFMNVKNNIKLNGYFDEENKKNNIIIEYYK